MNQFLYQVQKFMRGRNGVDKFSLFLIISGWVIGILSSIARVGYARLVGDALIIYSLYRILSKNYVKRSIENRKYMEIRTYVIRLYKVVKMNLSDRSHKYHLCPQCHQMVRTPRGHGKITVTCPSCHHHFDARS